MIEFKKEKDGLVLQYSPRYGNEWVYRRLNDLETIVLKKTFSLKREHLFGKSVLDDPEEFQTVEFKIGNKVGEYYKIDKSILSLTYGLFIHEEIDLAFRSFTIEKNVSIFSVINDLKPCDIYIGGSHQNNLPENEFDKLLKYFPNTYELRRYVLARASSVLRNYFDIKLDGEKQYRRYMNNKVGKVGVDLRAMFNEGEIFKFRTLLEKLEGMLKDENTYTESQWQKEILQILLLLYPKYIAVFKEAPVLDSYSKKQRKLDFLLVDSSGNVDIVEIKQPFDKCIVTDNQYRDNYIPLRELSGTLMQVEKYIFHLNKWGKTGEDFLSNKYKNELPMGFKIKITNPNAIIVMGRENHLSNQQKQDFEVIKRQYKNVLDIITYDDLIGRLRFTIEHLNKFKKGDQQRHLPVKTDSLKL